METQQSRKIEDIRIIIRESDFEFEKLTIRDKISFALIFIISVFCVIQAASCIPFSPWVMAAGGKLPICVMG